MAPFRSISNHDAQLTHSMSRWLYVKMFLNTVSTTGSKPVQTRNASAVRVVLFVATLASSAAGASPKDARRTPGPIAMPKSGSEITIGVAELPPFKFTEPGPEEAGKPRKITGSDTEIVTEVVRAMGYVPKITMAPWKRVLEDAAQGRYDLIYSMTRNPERERDYVFTAPVSYVKDVFFKQQKATWKWDSKDFADLARARVGASQGYRYAPFLMDAFAKKSFATIDLAAGDTPELQQLRKLARGRLDLVVCELNACSWLLRNAQPSDPVLGGEKIDWIERSIGPRRSFHAAIPRNRPWAEAFGRAFDEDLAKLSASGFVAKVQARYGLLGQKPD